jgi:hypothetical protein
MGTKWRRFFDWPICPGVALRLASLEFWFSMVVGRIRRRPWCEAPGWVQMVYVGATLVLGVKGLVLAQLLRDSHPWWSTVIGLLPLYFVFELALFILRWLFIDLGPLISSRRSLAGFLVNVVGVTIFFAAAFLGAGCISGEVTIRSATYNSFRTLTTMGPVSIQDGCWQCPVLVMAEGAMGYLLTVVIIGALAGIVAAERA